MKFQLSYFKSYKMMLLKCCTHYASKHSWKTQLENSAVTTGLESSVFNPITKKVSAKEWSNYCTIALISHARKIMLKILQARLQQVCKPRTSRCLSWIWKSRGRDGIPVELFQSWKMMLWMCCAQYASKFGKHSSGHRTGKSQFSFQSQRKAMPKNVQTTAQLHSSHMLVK